MWPDRVSNPGPLTYESDALPTALPGPAKDEIMPCEKTKTSRGKASKSKLPMASFRMVCMACFVLCSEISSFRIAGFVF